MYLPTEAISIPPPGAGDAAEAERVLATVRDRAGLRGAWVLTPLGHRAGTLVSLWDGEPGPHDYGVIATQHGPEPDEAPRFAALMWFDGPRSDALRRASDLAGPRLMGATENLPGRVEMLVGRAADNAELVLVLVTSVDVLEESARRIFATELLPGEDAALLPGPDRMDVCGLRGMIAPAKVG